MQLNNQYFNDTQLLKLKDLEKQAGAQIIQPLIELYINTTLDELIKMKDDLTKNIRDEVVRRAHSLKSSSANVGALKIRLLAETIENKLTSNINTDAKVIEALINEIDKDCAPTFEVLRKFTQKS